MLKRGVRGLQSPSIAVLYRDGVHLNEAGNYALYRSYRGAHRKRSKRALSKVFDVYVVVQSYP